MYDSRNRNGVDAEMFDPYFFLGEQDAQNQPVASFDSIFTDPLFLQINGLHTSVLMFIDVW